MSTSTQKNRRASLRRTRHGTLGIDIGSAAIKMARLEWVGGRWSITNRLILPVSEESSSPQTAANDATDVLIGEDSENTAKVREPVYRGLASQLEVLRSRPVVSKHECSCVLPMSLTDLRSVEVPDGSFDDVDQMAIETLREYYEDYDQRITKTWRHTETPHAMAMVSSVSVHSDVAESIVTDLNSVQLQCVSMDSLPFAMARAADMTASGQSEQPVALLDWGHSTVTLVIARNGHPEFVRRLRDCNGRDAIQSLADALRLTPEDVRHVLATCGLPSSGLYAISNAATESIQRLLMPEVDKVCAELQKTLLYLRHHLHKLMPSRLLLFGGMATIPKIADAFQERCGVKTAPWQLNALNSHVTDPVYGIAMAASVGRDWR